MTGPSTTPAAGARRFNHDHIWTLDEHTTWKASVRLAAALTVDLTPATLVIAIARGGVAPAEIIAKALAARLYILTAGHNPTDSVYTPATGTVTCDTPPDLADTLAGHACIVIVDDICGTGATLDTVSQLVHSHRPHARLVTVTLCRNTGASMVPDYYAWDVTDWVAFPWENPPPPDHPTRPLPPCDRVHRRG